MLPALLTAAVAALAPGDIGPDYGPDVGQTMQTVVFPADNRWKLIWSNADILQVRIKTITVGKPILTGDRGVQKTSMEITSMIIVTRQGQAIIGRYHVEPAAGPARFSYRMLEGTISTDGRDRFIIRFQKNPWEEGPQSLHPTTMILEHEKP